MDDGLSARAQEPRRPVEWTGSSGIADLPTDGSRDALVMQILSTEHFSLLSQRSLVYNEAFVRVGMFLTFMSMSFVALALLSGAMQVDQTFLLIATIVLGFDLIIGVATAMRVRAANGEDLLAVQAMARVRHAYLELAPETEPYFSTGTHDDVAGTLMAYAAGDSRSMRADLLYGLSTSGGMLILIVAVLAGTFGAVAAPAIGGSGVIPFAVGFLVALATLFVGVRWAYRGATRNQRNLDVRFPTPPSGRAGG
jgi:hypothetical protein